MYHRSAGTAKGRIVALGGVVTRPHPLERRGWHGRNLAPQQPQGDDAPHAGPGPGRGLTSLLSPLQRYGSGGGPPFLNTLLLSTFNCHFNPFFKIKIPKTNPTTKMVMIRTVLCLKATR